MNNEVFKNNPPAKIVKLMIEQNAPPRLPCPTCQVISQVVYVNPLPPFETELYCGCTRPLFNNGEVTQEECDLYDEDTLDVDLKTEGQ